MNGNLFLKDFVLNGVHVARVCASECRCLQGRPPILCSWSYGLVVSFPDLGAENQTQVFCKNSLHPLC